MPKKPKGTHPVRFIREVVDLTQREFAKELRVSESFLQDIELGSRRLSPELADRMMVEFGFDSESLQQPSGLPRLANGKAVRKGTDPRKLRPYVEAWRNERRKALNLWTQMELKSRLLPKIEKLFDKAGKAGTAPLMAVDLVRWIEKHEAQLSEDTKAREGSVASRWLGEVLRSLPEPLPDTVKFEA